MVNLLPYATQNALRRAYYFRIAGSFFFVTGCALLVGVVMLAPSFLLIHADADDAERYVTTLKGIADQRSKNASSEALAAFGEQVRLMNQLYRAPLIERALARATTNIPKGISINKISADYDKEGDIKLSMSGTALTRAALIAYTEQLKSSAEFSNVVVPVSALVLERDAEFSVTAEFKKGSIQKQQ